ncbi:hypothetical protein [uncultured Paludibaculum sp.]|uniref:hypothetical protein n=1 Tax=uncultured Paludibaculum sp. TaxID=1765020 RepID=UPI002AAA7CE9|nr:hypothetical protein [uncultured Paludibaculum sp.]
MNGIRNNGPVQDLHELQQRLLVAGICVNGCGPLTVLNEKERRCPKCGFMHYAHPQFTTATNAEGAPVRNQDERMRAAYAAGVCPVDGSAMVPNGDPHTTQCISCGFQHMNFFKGWR